MKLCIGLILLFLSCNKAERGKSANADSIATRKYAVRSQASINLLKLKEYKKVAANRPTDTLPYPNTYVIVNKEYFIYYRRGKVFSKDILVKTKDEGIYTLKNRKNDLLFFTYGKQEIVALEWTKSSFEGEYEYFRK